MSLKEEERRVLVTLELEKVDKTLEEMEAKIQPTRLLIDKINSILLQNRGRHVIQLGLFTSRRIGYTGKAIAQVAIFSCTSRTFEPPGSCCFTVIPLIACAIPYFRCAESISNSIIFDDRYI